jgi:3-oxoacyl-[acyl-carrier protein] reductase
VTLEGKVALVTAAAGAGIGAAVATRLARDGATVVVTDKHEGRSTAVAEKLAAEYSVPTLALPFDVTDVERARQVAAEVGERLGGIDILINNAAVNTMEYLLHEVPAETFDRLWAGNYRTPHELVALSLPHMVEQRWGVIVNISSTAPDVGGGYFETPYALAKSALNQLAMVTAVEYSRFGVRANSVATGVIWNDRANLLNLMPEDYWDKVRLSIPEQRFGRPEEVANVVGWLCSEESTYIQGNVIRVSGGINMGGPEQNARYAERGL